MQPGFPGKLSRKSSISKKLQATLSGAALPFPPGKIALL
jgi:hypothetical protein